MDGYRVFPNPAVQSTAVQSTAVQGMVGRPGAGCGAPSGFTSGGARAGVVRRRAVADRRRIIGDGRRPGGAPLRYGTSGMRVSIAEHRRSGSPSGLASVVITGLVMVVTVLGLLGLAHLRAAGTDPAVPTSVGVVQVRAGEGLGGLAHRAAPGVSTGVMVERIKELNGLTDSTVHQGQQLLVPVAQAG